MSKDNNPESLVPRLRFPEFADAGPFTLTPLSELASPVTERAGDADVVPYTITGGVGLVSQEEKLGRTIAGKSIRNYYRLKRGDFAFNKSSTKAHPEGYIARLYDDVDAAVPSSIFVCFRCFSDDVDGQYLDWLFQANLHGHWLRKFITVGARAHGALNVNDDDLYAIPVPLPPGRTSRAEQRKIAECLGSLDDWIAAETEALTELRRHKTGLMQQLFPRPGETRPRLRFPEFKNAGDWDDSKLGPHVKLTSGVHLAPEAYAEEGDDPYFTGPTDFTNDVRAVGKWADASPASAQADDTLVTVKGSGVGQLWHLELERVVIGRQLMAVRMKDGSNPFLFYLLQTQRRRLEDLSLGNLIPGLSRGDILTLDVAIPKLSEQHRVADCLASLDARISAHDDKLIALREHKRGLMQQLFPAPDDLAGGVP